MGNYFVGYFVRSVAVQNIICGLSGGEEPLKYSDIANTGTLTKCARELESLTRRARRV